MFYFKFKVSAEDSDQKTYLRKGAKMKRKCILTYNNIRNHPSYKKIVHELWIKYGIFSICFGCFLSTPGTPIESIRVTNICTKEEESIKCWDFIVEKTLMILLADRIRRPIEEFFFLLYDKYLHSETYREYEND